MTPSPRLGSPPLRWLMSSITVAALATALAGAPQAAASAAPAGARACTGPAGDAFYVPPRLLPSGPHGTIIWCRVSLCTAGTAPWA